MMCGHEPGAAAPVPAVDADMLRGTLGQFATGVAVISTLDAEGRAYGITVSSFASLSLDPPLVQWSLRHKAFSYPIFRLARHFAVNVLAADQEALSRHFCAQVDRFAELTYETGLNGLPLLPDALAWIECERRDEFSGGDHAIFVGEVVRARHRAKPPLVHWQGRYHRLADA